MTFGPGCQNPPVTLWKMKENQRGPQLLVHSKHLFPFSEEHVWWPWRTPIFCWLVDLRFYSLVSVDGPPTNHWPCNSKLAGVTMSLLALARPLRHVTHPSPSKGARLHLQVMVGTCWNQLRSFNQLWDPSGASGNFSFATFKISACTAGSFSASSAASHSAAWGESKWLGSICTTVKLGDKKESWKNPWTWLMILLSTGFLKIRTRICYKKHPLSAAGCHGLSTCRCPDQGLARLPVVTLSKTIDRTNSCGECWLYPQHQLFPNLLWAGPSSLYVHCQWWMAACSHPNIQPQKLQKPFESTAGSSLNSFGPKAPSMYSSLFLAYISLSLSLS